MTKEEKEELDIEKLLESLKYIRLICLNMESCLSCPLRRCLPNECYINRKAPRNWKIKSKEETWRAFND